jgi:nucleotide-binding universal stress UspA family protein
MLRKISCPIDFSPGSQKAMQFAARLAKRTDAELRLVHSSYVPPTAFAGEYMISPEAIQALSDDAALGLDAAVRDATALGVKHVSTKLVAGSPWQQIVELAESEPTDLIVIGTHGRTGLARVLLGSVAEKVVRHAPCATLAVHPQDEPKRWARVLCPIDFSDGSQQATELAAELVESDGGEITLLHVVELASSYFEAPQADAFLRELDARSAAKLEEWATQLRAKTSVRVKTRLRLGNPGEQILATLDDGAFDLVVTGSHGRTGLKRAVLGSVAEKIVRYAACPVVVARKRP